MTFPPDLTDSMVTACPHCQAQLDPGDPLPELFECSRDELTELAFDGEDVPECPECGRVMKRSAPSVCPECSEPLRPSEMILRGTFEAADGTWHLSPPAVEDWEAAAPQRAAAAKAAQVAEDAEREDRNDRYRAERAKAIAVLVAAVPGAELAAAMGDSRVLPRFMRVAGGVLLDVHDVEAPFPGRGKRLAGVPGSERLLTVEEAQDTADALGSGAIYQELVDAMEGRK